MKSQPTTVNSTTDRRLLGGLWAALVLSVAFHLFVLIPIVLLILSPPTSAREIANEIEQTPNERNPSPPLGGDEGSPSSLVWIGYDTYQEHLAELADVEQAAFTPSPAGAPNAQPMTAQPATPGQEDTGQDQQTSNVGSELATADQPAQPETEQEQDEAQQSQGLVKAPLSEFGNQVLKMAPVIGTGPLIFLPLPEATQSSDTTKEQPTPSPNQTKQETAAPGQTESPEAKEVQPGTPADRESDATSTLKVPIEKWKIGRPLQAEGYKILTTKPQLTPLQQVSGTLGMRQFPVVEIVFLTNGRPDDVRVIQSSGNKRADEILRQSVFKWRAQGKALEERAKDDPLIVRIQITFTRRRR